MELLDIYLHQLTNILGKHQKKFDIFCVQKFSKNVVKM